MLKIWGLYPTPKLNFTITVTLIKNVAFRRFRILLSLFVTRDYNFLLRIYITKSYVRLHPENSSQVWTKRLLSNIKQNKSI